jgi:hypothetical protein
MIMFSGIDILLDQTLGRDQLCHGVSAVLSVPAARVAVIHDVAQYPERGTADIVCVVTPTTGDFVELVSIQCETMVLRDVTVIDLVQRLASQLQAKILAPVDGPDPYLMWLVEPHREPRHVGLNVAALDQNRYELSSGPGHTNDV